VEFLLEKNTKNAENIEKKLKNHEQCIEKSNLKIKKEFNFLAVVCVKIEIKPFEPSGDREHLIGYRTKQDLLIIFSRSCEFHVVRLNAAGIGKA
jgi:hypothetical protein